MKTKFTMSALVAIAALGGAACADEARTDTTTSTTAVEGAATTDTTTGATKMVDAAVYDSSGAQIGTIDEIVTAADGSQQAVVSVGTFLGLGEKKIVVPVTSLSESADGSGFNVEMTSDEIEAAPEYMPNEASPE